MPGIGYAESYKVASIVTVNISYAQHSDMPGICYVETYKIARIVTLNISYAIYKVASTVICQEYGMLILEGQRSICFVNKRTPGIF